MGGLLAVSVLKLKSKNPMVALSMANKDHHAAMRARTHLLLVLAMCCYLAGTWWGLTAITVRSPWPGIWHSTGHITADNLPPTGGNGVPKTLPTWQPEASISPDEAWVLLDGVYYPLVEHGPNWYLLEAGQVAYGQVMHAGETTVSQPVVVGPEQSVWDVISQSWQR